MIRHVLNTLGSFRSALAVSVGLPFLVAASAFAQDPTTSEPTEAVTDRVIVTGSYIPMAADAPAAPVAIINAAELAKTGTATNLLDMIRKAVPQFTGSSNIVRPAFFWMVSNSSCLF